MRFNKNDASSDEAHATSQAKNTTLIKDVICNRITTFRSTVLIFDSGVGGLSVYNAVQKLLPDLHYLYVFDNLSFPYGEKSEEFIVERVLEIIRAVEQRHTMSIAIIACNTASTVSLSVLREEFSFPIVGVVPAIKSAARFTANGIIGLLATSFTIQCSYTHELIARFAFNCDIKLLSSPELVELAEAKLHGKTVPIAMLKKILQPWLQMTKPPDTVVLGCTHFSLLIEELTLVLPAGVLLVDSSTAIARHTACLIAKQEHLVFTQEDNVAYCTMLHGSTISLLPILQWYGFKTLKQLML